MSLHTRNNSFNFKKTPLNQRRSIFQKRLSSVLSKEQKVRSPSLWINHSKQKRDSLPGYIDIHKSADIGYYMQKQRGPYKEDQQSTENASYSYIGQIQALQSRRIGRKNLNRHVKQDSSAEDHPCAEIISKKIEEFSNLDHIKVNQQLSKPYIAQKKTTMQVEVQELHYNMVLIQQKYKKKYFD